jgi:type II secretory pathway component GspD/PulD (secretin)
MAAKDGPRNVGPSRDGQEFREDDTMRRFYHSHIYLRIRIPFHLALLAILAGPLWLGACPAFAAPAASQPAPTGASPQPATQPSEAEMIQLNLPKNLQVKTLVEYISQRMQMNILYDESLVKGTVTVNSPAKIPKDSLMDLFKGILKINGLVLVEADQPGWKRIVASKDLLLTTRQVDTTVGRTIPDLRQRSARLRYWKSYSKHTLILSRPISAV